MIRNEVYKFPITPYLAFLGMITTARKSGFEKEISFLNAARVQQKNFTRKSKERNLLSSLVPQAGIEPATCGLGKRTC